MLSPAIGASASRTKVALTGLLRLHQPIDRIALSESKAKTPTVCSETVGLEFLNELSIRDVIV